MPEQPRASSSTTTQAPTAESPSPPSSSGMKTWERPSSQAMRRTSRGNFPLASYCGGDRRDLLVREAAGGLLQTGKRVVELEVHVTSLGSALASRRSVGAPTRRAEDVRRRRPPDLIRRIDPARLMPAELARPLVPGTERPREPMGRGRHRTGAVAVDRLAREALRRARDRDRRDDPPARVAHRRRDAVQPRRVLLEIDGVAAQLACADLVEELGPVGDGRVGEAGELPLRDGRGGRAAGRTTPAALSARRRTAESQAARAGRPAAPCRWRCNGREAARPRASPSRAADSAARHRGARPRCSRRMPRCAVSPVSATRSSSTGRASPAKG